MSRYFVSRQTATYHNDLDHRNGTSANCQKLYDFSYQIYHLRIQDKATSEKNYQPINDCVWSTWEISHRVLLLGERGRTHCCWCDRRSERRPQSTAERAASNRTLVNPVGIVACCMSLWKIVLWEWKSTHFSTVVFCKVFCENPRGKNQSKKLMHSWRARYGQCYDGLFPLPVSHGVSPTKTLHWPVPKASNGSRFIRDDISSLSISTHRYASEVALSREIRELDLWVNE